MSSGGQLTVSRKELYEKLHDASYISRQSRSEPEIVLLEYVKTKFNLQHCSESMLKELNRVIHSFVNGFHQRWKQCHRNKKAFLNKYNQWVNSTIVISNQDLPSTSGEESRKKAGRPEKDFDSSSLKTKTRKLKSLVKKSTLSELTHATGLKLRKLGKRDADSMLGELVSTPKRATKIKKIFHSKKELPKFSVDEALALITATKLSFRKYRTIRRMTLSKGLRIYPSYDAIKKAKQLCYPCEDECKIDETSAEVKLQAIVDLTVQRLCIVQNEVLQSLFDKEKITVRNITMIFKWGCDGSGGQSRYKQKVNEETFEDSNILVTSMVPLQLHGLDEQGSKVIIWQNPRPASTSYCRPIRFRFTKESDQAVLEEFENVRNQIAVLTPTIIEINGQRIEVFQKFEETMVDGKVCNILANNRATQTCYICLATSKQMNKLDEIRQRPCHSHTFSWGLSTLHAQIRLMECVLHIGYRLDVKKLQCRTPQDKKSVADRKKEIIERFRKETGLLLDTPKQGGGNTNDGNSARRFFKNAAITSEITGVDQRLIEKFYVILRTLTSGFEIDFEEFKRYCDETADLYVSLYNWYAMPVTLHKILLHGPEVIKHLLLPIGQMSEEAQESRHKEVRKFRLEHTRKAMRSKTNEDILHTLLISSDPLISSLKPVETTKSDAVLHPEVLKLIKAPTLETVSSGPEQSDINDTDDDTDSDFDD